jgi:hypothetical protein
MGDHPWVQWNVRDKFDSILQHKIGILIFFVHDTLPLSHTISAINYIGFGFSKSKCSSFIDIVLYRRNL